MIGKLRKEWLNYESTVLSRSGFTAPQISEAQKVFYAGAVCMYGAVMEISESPSEEDRLLELDALRDELFEFERGLIARWKQKRSAH